MPRRVIRFVGRKVKPSGVIVGALLGALCSLGMALLLIYQQVGAINEDAHGLQLTAEMISESERVLSTIKDAETGQRGYLLTGRIRYLEPYNEASNILKQRIDHMEVLSQKNGVQAKHWPDLRILIDRKMGELKRTIELKRSGQDAAALAIVMTDSGVDSMDSIRSLIATIQSEERTWQGFRQQSYQRATERAKHTILALFLFSFLPALAAVAYTIRLGEKHSI